MSEVDITQIEQAVSTRARVRISQSSGWAKGMVGIALGLRTLHGSVKVGFLDDAGNYCGDYTTVSYAHVELDDEQSAAEKPAAPIVQATSGMIRDKRSDGRVCAECNAILRWYAWRDGGAFMHVRLNGQFYITGHRPTPKPTI